MKKSFKHYTVSLVQKIRRVLEKNLGRIFSMYDSDIRGAFVSEFENMTNAEKVLTQELEDMLSYIAKTGRVL